MHMARPNYVCATCEHFTRKYSAKRHNITVHHNNGGKIVTLVEYLVRRSSGRYQPSYTFWSPRASREKRIHNFGRTMVADSVRDVFRTVQREQQAGDYQFHQQSSEERERYHRGQQQSLSPSILPSPPAAIQDQAPDVLPYSTDPTFQPESMNSSDDEKTTTLSQETILKIQELKRLVYRYAQYYRNPDAIIKCATFWSINGDNMILDEMLERLRMIGMG
jgi:hypothetical protein